MTLDEIRRAHERLAPVVHRTPLLTSARLSARVGGRVVLKAEHLQRTGSFKIRGAYNRIASLEDRTRGVVAASAGNHAQGVAWAARSLGVPATVVMPVYASLSKVEATRGYGASVVLHGEAFEDAFERARKLAAEEGATFVHPFDDPAVIAGQGTVGVELCEDGPEAERVVVPVGGGGLIAGVATAVKALRPGTRVVGVHPSATPFTIADGAAVKSLGGLAEDVVAGHVDEIVEVDDEAVSEAIVLLLESTKQVVEGAGALPLAALLAGAVPASGTSLLVASGGNIDPGQLMQVIRHGLGESGRYLFVSIRLEDRPGQLLRVLGHLASEHVNVLSVTHHRASPDLPVGGVDVELTLETRDRRHAEAVVEALREAGFHVRR